MKLDSKIPEGPLGEKWSKHKFNVKLVNPPFGASAGIVRPLCLSESLSVSESISAALTAAPHGVVLDSDTGSDSDSDSGHDRTYR
jgi:hypothetical protein